MSELCVELCNNVVACVLYGDVVNDDGLLFVRALRL